MNDSVRRLVGNTYQWYKRGEIFETLHREDGPAVEAFDCLQWWIDGERIFDCGKIGTEKITPETIDPEKVAALRSFFPIAVIAKYYPFLLEPWELARAQLEKRVSA